VTANTSHVGSPAYNSRAQTCAARGKTCSNCGKANHFHKLCRSAPARASQQPTTFIHNVSLGQAPFKMCLLMAGEVTLPVLLLNHHPAWLCSLQLPVRYGEKTLPRFWFKLALHGTKLLGLDLFNGLGFTLLDTTGSMIHTVAIPWQQQWPALFSGVGCLKVFGQKPLVTRWSPGAVTPVIQPLRRSPLALG